VKSGENFYLKSVFSRSYSRDKVPGVPGAHFMTGLMSPNYLKWKNSKSSPVDFVLTKPLFSLKFRKVVDSNGFLLLIFQDIRKAWLSFQASNMSFLMSSPSQSTG
jgi:hypothetical protein